MPTGARERIGGRAGALVPAICRGRTLVLRPGGPGAPIAVDGRGRFALPAWLRRAAVPDGSVLLAASRAGSPVVLVAPTACVDALADALAEGER
jgi:hypothetical protein